MTMSRTTSCRGFTLVEMSVSSAIAAVVIAGMLALYITYNRFYNTTTLMRNASHRASLGLERIVYGNGTNAGLREAVSSTIVASNWTGGWKLSYNTNIVYAYSSTLKAITNNTGKIICTNIVASTMTCNSNACSISVSVCENAGGDTWTNTMSTLVEFRN